MAVKITIEHIVIYQTEPCRKSTKNLNSEQIQWSYTLLTPYKQHAFHELLFLGYK